MGADIELKPLSYLQKGEAIDLYRRYQKIGMTDPGLFGWRLKRQFSEYYPKKISQVIGARHLGKLIGFVAWKDAPVLNPYTGEFTDPVSRETIRWHDQLLVSPLFRRQGIGTRLMEAFIDAAGDHPTVRNTVWQEWLVGFYTKFGFQLVTTGVIEWSGQRYWILERKVI